MNSCSVFGQARALLLYCADIKTRIQLLYVPILKVCIAVFFSFIVWIGWLKPPPFFWPVAVFG